MFSSIERWRGLKLEEMVSAGNPPMLMCTGFVLVQRTMYGTEMDVSGWMGECL